MIIEHLTTKDDVDQAFARLPPSGEALVIADSLPSISVLVGKLVEAQAISKRAAKINPRMRLHFAQVVKALQRVIDDTLQADAVDKKVFK